MDSPTTTDDTQRFGRKLIFISLFLAVVSMFLGWARFFIFSKTGRDLELLMLLVVWGYPAIASFFYFPIWKKVSDKITLLNMFVAMGLLIYIANKTVFFGLFSVSTDIGAWLYLFATFLLYGGIRQYTKNQLGPNRVNTDLQSNEAD